MRQTLLPRPFLIFISSFKICIPRLGRLSDRRRTLRARTSFVVDSIKASKRYLDSRISKKKNKIEKIKRNLKTQKFLILSSFPNLEYFISNFEKIQKVPNIKILKKFKTLQKNYLR